MLGARIDPKWQVLKKIFKKILSAKNFWGARFCLGRSIFFRALNFFGALEKIFGALQKFFGGARKIFGALEKKNERSESFLERANFFKRSKKI